MKTKTFDRKLKLNKKTIVDLTYGDMRFVNGGKTGTCETQVPQESVCLICTEACPTANNPYTVCCPSMVSCIE